MSAGQLKQAYAWYTIPPAVSLFLGPLCTGFVIDHGGYRPAFLMLSLLPALSSMRMPEWLLITVATVLAGLIFLDHPWPGTAFGMAELFAMGGMALGVVTPIVLILLHQYTPTGRYGEALVLRISMIKVFGVCMPVLFGAVGGAIGASAVFWVTGATVMLGSRLGLGLRRQCALPSKVMAQKMQFGSQVGTSKVRRHN